MFGAVLIAPFVFPPGLILAYSRQKPVIALFTIILILVLSAGLIWIYRKLRSPVVLKAMDEAKLIHRSFWNNPVSGFWLGGCLLVFLMAMAGVHQNSDIAIKAREKAAMQVGEGYKFHVSSLTRSMGPNGLHVLAIVTAYNDDQIKEVVIDWVE